MTRTSSRNNFKFKWYLVMLFYIFDLKKVGTHDVTSQLAEKQRELLPLKCLGFQGLFPPSMFILYHDIFRMSIKK